MGAFLPTVAHRRKVFCPEMFKPCHSFAVRRFRHSDPVFRRPREWTQLPEPPERLNARLHGSL